MVGYWKKLVVYGTLLFGAYFFLMTTYTKYGTLSYPSEDDNNTYFTNVTFPFNSSRNIYYTTCKTFQFDPVQWTLYRKSMFDDRIETKSCSSFHRTLFATKSVKRIVNPNKTTQNLGCTKNTRECTAKAHFDRRLNIRINNPPCCTEKLLQMLKIVSDGLNARRITYMLCGGALIGWIRNRKLVPYDYDLDLLVDKKDWRSPRFMKMLVELSRKYGFYYYFRKDKENLSIWYSKTNSNGIDIWSIKVLKNSKIVRAINNKFKDQHYDVMYPPRRANISGIAVYVPNKPEQYCDRRYGKGKWMKELMCKKTEGRKCVG